MFIPLNCQICPSTFAEQVPMGALSHDVRESPGQQVRDVSMQLGDKASDSIGSGCGERWVDRM